MVSGTAGYPAFMSDPVTLTVYVPTVANRAGGPKTVSLHGRQYLVVPIRIIVEGVLNGSQGAIFYSGAEIGRDPAAWNHVPLTLYHPVANGVSVSARHPEVLDRYGLGTVYNSHYQSPNLDAEGWFDKTITLDRQPTLYRDLAAGRQIELSSGLFLDAEPAPTGAVHNTVPYHWVGRNYRPDHVAVLPDQVGACSLRDGCGINVNTYGGHKVRDQNIQWLTANCACWKGRTEVLNQFTDDDLKILKEEAEQSARFRSILNKGIAYRGRKIQFDAARGGITVNTVSDTDVQAQGLEVVKEDNSPVPNDDPNDPRRSQTNTQVAGVPANTFSQPLVPTGNTQLQQVPVAQPVQHRLTQEEQEAIAWANNERQRQKAELINRLTGNVADQVIKAQVMLVYNKMGLGELQALVSAQPQPVTPTNNYYPSYQGGQPVVPNPQQVTNQDREDYLEQGPTINWEELANLPKGKLGLRA